MTYATECIIAQLEGPDLRSVWCYDKNGPGRTTITTWQYLESGLPIVSVGHFKGVRAERFVIEG